MRTCSVVRACRVVRMCNIRACLHHVCTGVQVQRACVHVVLFCAGVHVCVQMHVACDVHTGEHLDQLCVHAACVHACVRAAPSFLTHAGTRSSACGCAARACVHVCPRACVPTTPQSLKRVRECKPLPPPPPPFFSLTHLPAYLPTRIKHTACVLDAHHGGDDDCNHQLCGSTGD